MKVDRINMDKDNRKLRIGGGKYDGKPYFRVDLWFIGYRFEQKRGK